MSVMIGSMKSLDREVLDNARQLVIRSSPYA